MLHFATLCTLALFVPAFAAPSPTLRLSETSLEKRAASCTFPTPPKTSSLSSAMTIAAGQSLDGGNVRYDRGAGACQGQKEGGDKDAVFILEEGATLSNVVIGANQAEGVHCKGSCTLHNVWFEAVCEDAITIRQTSGISWITGGGAKGATDKVVQHNGGGIVRIDSYCVQSFGKLYRSCGNCSTQYKRTAIITNVIAQTGKLICGINTNYGDTCWVSGITGSSLDHTCTEYTGNNSGAEPDKLSTDVHDAYCNF